MTMEIGMARIGQAVEPGTVRILVDRLWPRGIAKASASWDLWARDLAPSTNLRRWYAHDPEKYAEFRHRYRQELDKAPGPLLSEVLEIVQRQRTVLVTYAREVPLSHVPVLREYLLDCVRRG
jgi:uncharacterized protein YeaO (DUF488 family)